MIVRNLRAALACATALTTGAVQAEAPTPAPAAEASAPSLEDQFRDPPTAARPRVWWHWMNGNITKDGIAKDLAWMKRVGIGGAQNFDANLQTPQIVDKRLIYMTPEWKDAFRFAASEADRLGLELAIASSPGWSETGGPWVRPEDGLKKLVWSETDIVGGRRFTEKLPIPPSASGPYQSLVGGAGLSGLSGEKGPAVPTHYADVAVLAYPLAGEAKPSAAPVITDGDGKVLDQALLTDSDLSTGIDVAKGKGPAPVLNLSYPTARTIRSATLYLPGFGGVFAGGSYNPRLEASDGGENWTPVAEIPVDKVPTTVAFAPVRARHFRVVFVPAKSSGFSFTPQVQGVDLMGLASIMGAAGIGAPKGLKINDLRLSDEDRVDRAETKAGFSIAQDYFALSKELPVARTIAPERVMDITDKLQSDGTLAWTPPMGRWRVVRLGYSLLGTMNHPAPAEATGLEVDKFDGPAVRRYLDHYIGMYREAVGADMIGANGVRALLNDSIEVGAANWTPQMVSQFKRLRGYDPTPWLPVLTGAVIGSRDRSDAFLYDYRRTLADLMASEHYGTIADVAHRNGLKVYGEALEDHRPSLGDDMAMRRYADVPMAALWTFRRQDGPKATYVADIKGAASVAHIYGQNLVAAESMTALLAPWAFGPSDLKRIIDLEFVTGVNRPVVHTSVHAPVDDKRPGLSLHVFGQYFNRMDTWAELAKPWIDYISRNALMLQQGRNVADVAYFYGEEGPLTALFGDKPVADAPRTHGYDFVNADALTSAIVNDGRELVSAGGARYQALYLGGSSAQMTVPTLRRLVALAEGGATIIGLKPTGNPSLAGDASEFASLTAMLWGTGDVTQVGRGRVIASSDVEAALRQVGIAADFRVTGSAADAEIPFVHRKWPDGDSYFLSNRKDRAESFEAHFRVTGKTPELWSAGTGTSQPVSYRIENGETVVPMTLAADESVHVVFRKDASAPSLAIRKLVPTEVGRVTAPWQVAFEAGRGAPAQATFDELAPLNENADARIKYFSGIATYSNSFTTPKGWKRGQSLWLDLGEAREVAEVSVNGKTAGYAWHAPYRVDLSQTAKPGRNTLQVRVANLWVNRLIGDQQPGAAKLTWTALPTYTKGAPLRRSGLIGPVTLLGQPTE